MFPTSTKFARDNHVTRKLVLANFCLGEDPGSLGDKTPVRDSGETN